MSYKAYVIKACTRRHVEIISACVDSTDGGVMFSNGACVLNQEGYFAKDSVLLLVTVDRADLHEYVTSERGFADFDAPFCRLDSGDISIESKNKIANADPIKFEPKPESATEYLKLVADRYFPIDGHDVETEALIDTLNAGITEAIAETIDRNFTALNPYEVSYEIGRKLMQFAIEYLRDAEVPTALAISEFGQEWLEQDECETGFYVPSSDEYHDINATSETSE